MSIARYYYKCKKKRKKEEEEERRRGRKKKRKNERTRELFYCISLYPIRLFVGKVKGR